MEPLYEEYLTQGGTVVKPYYWLSFSLDCTNCPYHIRTGEAARVPYTEFHQVFGFPWSTFPQTKHLTFYELRSSSGDLIQKGHASNCTGNHNHPESMLFERNGYLDLAKFHDSNIRHIILYSSNSPCNEDNHHCISKIFYFLMMYPDISLSVFFSQLYHTEEQCPASEWNRGALRNLASLWPQVTLNPVSGDIWHFILENFVSDARGSNVLQPFTAGRILTDRYNAYEINSITGVKPYFIDVLQTRRKENQNTKAGKDLKNHPSNKAVLGQPQPEPSQDPRSPDGLMLVPYTELPPIHVGQSPQKPRSVVRHLRMPQLSSSMAKDFRRSLVGSPVEVVEAINQSASSKEANEKNKGNGRNKLFYQAKHLPKDLVDR